MSDLLCQIGELFSEQFGHLQNSGLDAGPAGSVRIACLCSSETFPTSRPATPTPDSESDQVDSCMREEFQPGVVGLRSSDGSSVTVRFSSRTQRIQTETPAATRANIIQVSPSVPGNGIPRSAVRSRSVGRHVGVRLVLKLAHG